MILKIKNLQLKIPIKQKGFTLVELLLYMGIFSIVLYVLMQLFTGILSTHLESQATSSISQDGNYIISRFSYDIHQAQSITLPALGNTSTTTLQFTKSDGSYTYQLTGNNLFLTNTTSGETGQINSINTKVTGIHFATLGNGNLGNKASVQIILNLESRTVRPGNLTQTASFQTTIGTR